MMTLLMMQAAQAAEELRGNLDAERAAVIAYWRAVHEELLAPWQEAAGLVAAFPHSTDSLAMCNTLAGAKSVEFCQLQTLILCQVGLVAAIPHPTDFLVMCNTLAGVLAANPDLKSRIVNSLLQSGVLSVH